MSGETFDDPNREAVGLEPAWEEGTGGSEGETRSEPESPADEEEPEEDEEPDAPALDSMTKAQLLEYADSRGVEASDSMTKDEIKAAIEAA